MNISKILIISSALFVFAGCASQDIPDPDPSDETYGSQDTGADTDGMGGSGMGDGEFLDDDLAGGELASGVLDAGRPLADRQPITLRLSQLPRVLGIDVSGDEVRRILSSLGNQEMAADRQQVHHRMIVTACQPRLPAAIGAPGGPAAHTHQH